MKQGSLSRDEQKAVRDFSARLRDKLPHDIEQIRLYGSKARGDSHKESDIDLLLLVKKRTAEVDDVVIDLVCDILNEYGIFIETVTMTSRDYRVAREQQNPFAINSWRDSLIL